MKITKAHQAHISTAIVQSITKLAEKRKQTVQETLHDHIAYVRREGLYHELEKRIRWDLFSAAGLSRWVCDNVYPYANDTHVDTVLRNIMANL